MSHDFTYASWAYPLFVEHKLHTKLSISIERDSDTGSRIWAELHVRTKIEEAVSVQDPWRRQHPPSVPADAHPRLTAVALPGDHAVTDGLMSPLPPCPCS